jgi:hypothetical protein
MRRVNSRKDTKRKVTILFHSISHHTNTVYGCWKVSFACLIKNYCDFVVVVTMCVDMPHSLVLFPVHVFHGPATTATFA